MAIKVQQFLRKHPIFTFNDFAKAISADGPRSPNTIKALLAHHIKHGHIIRIRRRLFAAIPIGANPKTYPINPYLIAGHVANDAIIAYHSALNFYNSTYSSSYRFTYLTQHKAATFHFQSESYESVLFPPTLTRQNLMNKFVNIEDVQGLPIKVTSLERTLVDVLDKPKLGGGWEEVWRSLAMIERLKVENVVEYALLMGKASTIAKVGFYLSQHQQELNVSKIELNRLRKRCPISPYYVDHSAKTKGHFIAEWNIIIPQAVFTKEWEA